MSLRQLARWIAIAASISTAPVMAGGTFSPAYVLPSNGSTAPDGAWPRWELTRDPAASVLYGVTPNYGSTTGGTLFKITTGGVFTKIRDFGASGDVNGSAPDGPLLALSGSFYGVTRSGGNNAKGVLYKWNATSGYQVVYHFGTGTAGANPSGPLTLASDGNVYGTSTAGGACGQGVVFKLVPSTGAVSVLHAFCGAEGSSPMTGVIQAGNGLLYGTAYVGGDFAGGTLFSLTLAGAFTKLLSFGADANQPKFPSRLTLGSDGLLYGTSYLGGDSVASKGTLFSSTLAGAVSVRARFINAPSGMSNPSPWAALNERFTGVFYGVTAGQNSGNIFQFRATTNAVTNIYSFVYAQASWPEAGLTLGPDNNLWGNTTDGSNLYFQRAGTIYRIQSLTANP